MADVSAQTLGRNELSVKPAVGFTLPSAGVTPAPGIKMRDFVPVRTFGLGRALFRVRFPFPLWEGVRLLASSTTFLNSTRRADGCS